MVLLTVMLVGMAATGAEASAPAYYQVGYAKVDVNPYYNEDNHALGLMPVPLRGNSYEEKRLALPNKMDDNGDGKIDDNDGIFITCVAITDPSGNTILLYGTDFIGGFGSYVTEPVRESIWEKHPEITGDKVMIAGSHTHHSVAITLVNSKSLNANSVNCLKLYVERLKANFVKAAEIALADRSPARMYKGQIEAEEAKCATGPVGDTLNKYRPADDQVTVTDPGSERVYNSVRHYKIVVQDAMRTVTKQSTSPFYYYTFPKKNGNYIPDPDAEQETYVCGDNFNTFRAAGTGGSAGKYYVDSDGDWIDESLLTFRGDSGRPFVGNTSERAYVVHDVEVVSHSDHVSEGDDTMLITEFRFDDASKKPVVMINWRAHTNQNRYVSDDYDTEKWEVGFYTSFFQVSADWINAFRFVLEQEGYRPAYFNGASGNMSSSSRIEAEKAWLSYETETDRSVVKNKGNIYGSELAEVALELLKSSNMKQINKDAGDIKTWQIVYQTERNTVEPGLFLAGVKYAAAYIPAKPAGTKSYTITYWEDAAGNALIDKTNKQVMVDEATGTALKDPNGATYTDAYGKPVVGVKKVTGTYVVASIQHANSVVSRYGSTAAGRKLEMNVILIGDQWASVTAPNELFDRYSTEATLDTINQYNDWEKLLGKNLGTDFGEPWVLGYCNDGQGYVPSQVTFSYSQGVPGKAVGSYESQTCTFMPGTGEAMIEVYKEMLLELSGEATGLKEAYCQHCGETVQWSPLSQQLDISIQLCGGHFYADRDFVNIPEFTCGTATVTCLDLRGHTISGKERAMIVSEGSVLNIQDSTGKGVITGSGTPSGTENGGVAYVSGTLNLYSGTLTFAPKAGYSVKNGGIVYVSSGIFNMYGGTVKDGSCTWVGGNFYVSHTGAIGLYGGQITGGNADHLANTACVLNRGKLYLSGDPKVEHLRIWPDTGKEDHVPLSQSIHVSGVCTATMELIIEGAAKGLTVGTAENANLYRSNITVKGSSYTLRPEGNELKLNSVNAAYMLNKDGTRVGASSLQSAITVAPEGATVGIEGSVTGDITVNKNLHLELNGWNINGTVTVSSGKTLYVSDACTDDYTVANGIYGKIKAVKGTVKGEPVTETKDGYLKITEKAGTSFHAVGLTIQSMSLRPEEAGLYYNCSFRGDEKVSQKVYRYGVAMSTSAAPSASNIFSKCSYTWFTDGFGTGKNSGSLLTGVMKNGLTSAENRRRGEMAVYGRAYIYTTDGEFMFGAARQRSFREQMELADAGYDTLSRTQQTGLADLYKAYASAMQNWNLTNVK